MVTPQATHNTPESHGDSVRITAQDRHDVKVEFLLEELARQQVIAAFEANDLQRLKDMGLPYAQAERRAGNATAVLQYLGSTLRALGYNRDFKAVQR